MADIFDVVADSTRRDILGTLLAHHSTDTRRGEVSVSAIVAELGLSQPTVSKHLKVLREAGLVAVREEGQHRYYHLDYGPLEEIEDWLIPFLSVDFDSVVEAVEQGDGLKNEQKAFAAAIGKVVADASHAVKDVAPKAWRKGS
ncbi:metalloregulator ArsR/SmtB family transcription factor [Rathayibacter sp. YIM 133350]|uniref:ArsR/SmtB family transcription factor n=1 Tax=Rathayibacter sp. YIM 133350 TaxID=3131992 RepID=UPI00307E8D37